MKSYMLMSQINIMSIGLLVLFLALTTIDAQNECSGRSAECINIQNCPQIVSMLSDPRPLSAEVVQILRDLQCGFEGRHPKICCNQIPTTTTTTTTTTVEPEIETDPPDVTNHPNLRLLDHQACGPVPTQKVIGGNKTEIFQYPWMALIAYDTGRQTLNPEFRCGGTIISSRYVLTAAHCVTLLPKSFRVTGVRVGDHDISKDRDCTVNSRGLEVVCAEKYQEFGAESIHYHPGYTKQKLHNDIALIRVNGSINFRPQNVKPICLPFGTAATLIHRRAIVTGWGMTEFGTRSQDLLQARLPLVSNEQCHETYKRLTQIWYKQLCAGGQLNVDSCTGDSGGPLQASGRYNGASTLSNRIIQYGIVSYGMSQCGSQGYPAVYTRVSYYMDWILNTMTD